jgi:predicted naringenin-chalcone synthase
MSSGTILFVLERELRRAGKSAVAALGFGPGLTMEGAILLRP